MLVLTINWSMACDRDDWSWICRQQIFTPIMHITYLDDFGCASIATGWWPWLVTPHQLILTPWSYPPELTSTAYPGVIQPLRLLVLIIGGMIWAFTTILPTITIVINLINHGWLYCLYNALWWFIMIYPNKSKSRINMSWGWLTARVDLVCAWSMRFNNSSNETKLIFVCSWSNHPMVSTQNFVVLTGSLGSLLLTWVATALVWSWGMASKDR